MNLTLDIKAAVKSYIAQEAYDPKYGARPLRRMIQTKVEDMLAEEVLAGNIKQGDAVDIKLVKNEIKTFVKNRND